MKLTKTALVNILNIWNWLKPELDPEEKKRILSQTKYDFFYKCAMPLHPKATPGSG